MTQSAAADRCVELSLTRANGEKICGERGGVEGGGEEMCRTGREEDILKKALLSLFDIWILKI